ncbi:hypothetical protein D3273_03420 [Lichenibacterium minor]|jgi:hypothetical protein|uniref:Uncharacterized protein n=1 Tax=Lichenibacterium minor TaxID=2316528 RepID=A0A4Q2UBU1_9HYPH|nr:hypothetical protein [Lichenibacterium minor]RYC33528.1 hypothetical protein D3273_03420 [Lichenibacterium minor]
MLLSTCPCSFALLRFGFDPLVIGQTPSGLGGTGRLRQTPQRILAFSTSAFAARSGPEPETE